MNFLPNGPSGTKCEKRNSKKKFDDKVTTEQLYNKNSSGHGQIKRAGTLKN